MTTIATVCGETTPAELGKTLMHEHLVIGYPGFESHTTRPGPNAQEQFEICVDKIAQLQDLGFTSMLDPCPNDLGRDVELAAKVGQARRDSTNTPRAVCPTGTFVRNSDRSSSR